MSDYFKNWRKQNPKSKETIRRDNIKIWAKRRGISEELFIEMQKGPCDICGATETKAKANRFHVDHDHVTNKVRGKLCHECNHAVGHMEKLVRRGLLDKTFKYIYG